MRSIRRVATAATIAAALCAPATAAADDWYKTGVPGETTQERITPDARDAGRPAVQVVPAPTRTRIVEVPRTGFEWGDAAIGGAATLAFVLLLGGVGMTVRPRHTATPSS